jgi:hypothetical protein
MQHATICRQQRRAGSFPQLTALTCSKLARILRSFLCPRWTIWLVYLLTVLTASLTFLGSLNGPDWSYVYLAAVSSPSWVFLRMALKTHEESGARQCDITSTIQSEQASTLRSSLTFSRWLRVCIAANAAPVLAHVCGSIAIAVVTALAAKSNGIWWCRWIILVRFFLLNLCHSTA